MTVISAVSHHDLLILHCDMRLPMPHCNLSALVMLVKLVVASTAMFVQMVE
jgi:hypothetical protein